MPNIYLSKETKEKLEKFIRKSRISPVFGSPNKFKSPNEAISFLLEIGLKFPLSSLEKIAKQPFVEFKMKMSDEEFEEFEKSGKIREIVEEKLREAEEGTEENEATT
jgi:hypothetical protein